MVFYEISDQKHYIRKDKYSDRGYKPLIFKDNIADSTDERHKDNIIKYAAVIGQIYSKACD